jgi:hypothetical protein
VKLAAPRGQARGSFDLIRGLRHLISSQRCASSTRDGCISFCFLGYQHGPNQPARSREQNELDSIAPHGLDDGPRNASEVRLAQAADGAISTFTNERWVETSASPIF